jgi:hypothetical protein
VILWHFLRPLIRGGYTALFNGGPDVVRVEVLEIKGAKYTELSEWGKDIAKLFFSPPRCPFFQHTDRDLALGLPW